MNSIKSTSKVVINGNFINEEILLENIEDNITVVSPHLFAKRIIMIHKVYSQAALQAVQANGEGLQPWRSWSSLTRPGRLPQHGRHLHS